MPETEGQYYKKRAKNVHDKADYIRADEAVNKAIKEEHKQVAASRKPCAVRRGGASA